MKVILIALLLLTSYSFSQTCVIARKTKKAIYVGADSRITIYRSDYQGHSQTDTGSICKIHRCGKFNFAVIGASADISINEAKAACLKDNSFTEVINLFADSENIVLQNRLETLRIRSLYDFLKLTSENSPYLTQVIFFGKESDSLFLGVVRFQLANNVPVQLYGSLGKSNLIYAGHIDEIRDTIEKPTTWKNGAVKTIKALINVEANAFPLFVGGDIDILKVTKRKTKWLYKKSMCD